MKFNYICLSFCLLLVSSLFNTLNSQCIEGQHSPFEEHAWLSCDKQESPIQDLSNHHWVQYDLDHIYSLDSLLIWNYNVWGNTESGIKRLQIWSSLDGLNWLQYDNEFELSKAPGSWKYSSPEVISLNGLAVQHILIVVIETFNSQSSCAGLSEVQIYADEVTSTEDLTGQLESEIILGPNPATDFLNVYFKKDLNLTKILIYNSLGKTVQVINEINYPKTQVDISNIDAGFYVLLFQSEGGYFQKQFVKLNP